MNEAEESSPVDAATAASEATSATEATEAAEVGIDRLVDLLSEALGQEKAQHVVRENLQTLGLQGRGSLGHQECKQVLDSIAEEGGLVAIVTRLAKIKLISSRSKDG